LVEWVLSEMGRTAMEKGRGGGGLNVRCICVSEMAGRSVGRYDSVKYCPRQTKALSRTASELRMVAALARLSRREAKVAKGNPHRYAMFCDPVAWDRNGLIRSANQREMEAVTVVYDCRKPASLESQSITSLQ